MRVAFVHDWLVVYGGAERALEALVELYPDAPIYTLVYSEAAFRNSPISQRKVFTSFIQRLPKAVKKYRSYLPLMPIAVEQFDLGGFDVILSSFHAVAKGVLARPDQLHISYVQNIPLRYARFEQSMYLREARVDRGIKGVLARLLLHYVRVWDEVSANRVDVYVANSRYVAEFIRRLYRRRAKVIYPPVNVDFFEPMGTREDFYLVVSRLVPFKRIDIIVKAFTQLGLSLVVIGDGPEMQKLKAIAGKTIKFLGWQPSNVVRDYLQRCKAFVFASEEAFGIAPVEAQAAGAPVIAFGKGGVSETVVPGETGLFFYEQTVESLTDAVRDFESSKYRFDSVRIRQNAERFSKTRFQREFAELMDREWAKFTEGARVR